MKAAGPVAAAVGRRQPAAEVRAAQARFGLARIGAIAVAAFATAAWAQSAWRPLASGTQASLRGVSVVSERVVWASGTGGTWLRTTDGGAHWKAGRVLGAAGLDFRGVVGIDARRAALMAAGPGASSRVYETADGGAHWTRAWQARAASAFLDGLAFWNRRAGLALSDPVGGKFLVLKTSDGGRNWRATRAAGMPAALGGEGAFAASNTALALGSGGRAWFVTGGAGVARVFASRDGGQTWRTSVLPLASGSATGAFSIAVCGRRLVVVGGDYTHPRRAGRNAASSADGGRTWTLAAPGPPDGYMSAVACRPGTGGRELIAVGPGGSDVARDGGRRWSRLDASGFNAVDFVPSGRIAYAVGPRGAIATLAWPH